MPRLRRKIEACESDEKKIRSRPEDRAEALSEPGEESAERALGRADLLERRLADASAARDELGFVADVSLDTGLRRLVEWWAPQREEIAAARTVPAR